MSRRPSRAAITASLAAVAIAGSSACGDDSTRPATDGSVERDGATSPDAGLVTSPAPPVLAPCPAGWREIDAGGATACEPWPEGGRAVCSAGQAHFPGEPGCRTVGAECPSGTFPDDAPEDGSALFVLAGASGGDGTREAPFGTLREALATADPSDVVVLSRGTFEGGVDVPPGVTIRGACAAETSIVQTTPGASAALLVGRGAIRLRDVRVGGIGFGIIVTGAGTTELDGVIVDAATSTGLGAAAAGHVVARDLVVRGTRADAAGRFGIGVLAVEGGRIELSRAVIEDNLVVGISIDGAGSFVRATDAVVARHVEEPATGSAGRGVSLQREAGAELERVVVEQSAEVGIFAVDPATTLLGRDVVVRDGRGQTSGMGGRGIAIARSATATIERARIDANAETGLHAITDARVVARDLLVRGTRPQASDGRFGFGIAVLESTFEATRVVLEGNTVVGLGLEGGFAGEPSTATLTDVVIRGTRATATGDQVGFFGRGINLQLGSTIAIERASIENNHEVGIAVAEGSRASLIDVAVLGTEERACVETTCAGNGAGTALSIYTDGYAEARRFILADNALAGVQLARGGTADLHDGEVTRNAIGANVQDSAYDLARLMDRVRYTDNGANFDSTALPVPEPVYSSAGSP